MKTRLAVCILAVAVLAVPAASADDLKADAQRTKEAFIRADSGLATFFNNAAAYAVFPSVGKGGLILGGAHGKGLVYEKQNVIGQASLSQATVGAQVGGQSFSEVIFFETSAALQDFKEGKFEMSADVSAVVAGEGASKSAKYSHGVAVFTIPIKGLMVQASIGGQKFTFEPVPVEPTGHTGQNEK